MSINSNIYSEITESIIKQLENTTIAPWNQPWVSTRATSFATGKPYSYLNSMLLASAGEFITWAGIQAERKKAPNANIYLRKGSVGHHIFLWKFINVQETDEQKQIITTKQVPILRRYTVFNVADVEGLEPRWQHQTTNTIISPIKQAEDLARKYLQRERIELRHDNPNEAYYSISRDFINLPQNFKSAEQYASVLFHECTHSTGHPSRLNRFKFNDHSAPFGSENYSREELVAEMGSAFILRRLGIDTTTTQQQNAAYIKSWIRVLRNDTSMVVVAAGKAEKATRYIFGEDLENEQQ